MAVDQELLFLLKSIYTKAVFEQKAPLKMSGYTKTPKTQIKILSIILDVEQMHKYTLLAHIYYILGTLIFSP